MIENDNDNVSGPPNGSAYDGDAHGRAAMLLVESLIHALIARSALTVEDAIEVVEVAADVDMELALELDIAPATLKKSLDLLARINASLRHDVPLPAVRLRGGRRAHSLFATHSGGCRQAPSALLQRSMSS